MSIKSFKLAVIISVLILAGAGLFLIRQNFSREPGSFFSGGHESSGRQLNGEGDASGAPAVYTHPVFGFNITLPAGFSVGNFPEGESGEVVLVQGKHQDKDYSMQIYVAPFEGGEAITLQKIRNDIPDLKMENAQDVQAGGAPAGTFIDAERNTREIWFTWGGNLYQISSRPEDDNVTGYIMESWEWQ